MITDSKTIVSNWMQLLRHRAGVDPDLRTYTFLLDGEEQEVHLTFGDLDRLARRVAAQIQPLVSIGDRVLVLYEPGPDFIVAVFGCFYAGVVAVPAYPPQPTRLKQSSLRLRKIVENAGIQAVLTSQPIRSYTEPLFTEFRLHWVQTDVVDGEPETAWREPDVSGDSLAVLQYTSGSTADPKGVMQSHSNLFHNSSLIYKYFGHSPDTHGVIWLPPYHDMGLIGGILHVVYASCSVTLMSPVSFLMRPIRWLKTISRTKATISGGPNFAYDLCVRKIRPEQRSELDLSSWTVAFNGSDTVRAETIQRFTEAFESCGFRPEAFNPCYGLAESTLFVSSTVLAEPPFVLDVVADSLEKNRVRCEAKSAKVRSLVSCGVPAKEMTVKIVDPETRALCESDQVGEIWISGESVAQGYWNQLALTEEIFDANLEETSAGPFLRTGDLGFLRDGRLFITGRLKDLVIVCGRNHYPGDIEQTVQHCHPAIRPGGCAVFSVDLDEEERVVVLVELNRKLLETSDDDVKSTTGFDDVARIIREVVSEYHDIRSHIAFVVRPASIPKTPTGKIQRHACRTLYLMDTENVIRK